MRRLFLASEINRVAHDIAKRIGKDPKTLKTAFINTAAEAKDDPNPQFLNKNRNGLVEAGFNLFDYTLTDKTSDQIQEDLEGCDIIHVNGGVTPYLLLQARKSGFDKFIKKFVDEGGIYLGSSAGSIIVSPDIYIRLKEESEKYKEELKTFEGLSLVNFIIFPHWGRDKDKDPYLDFIIPNAYVTGNKIILLTDTQYVLVEDDMYQVIDVGDEDGN
jgi:dipeptidase E